MTNDFHLFDDDRTRDVDPDIALVTACLAGELTLVQVVAVQDRLATDAAFRAKVGPLIEGWAVPGAWDAGQLESGTSSLTRGEIDAAWQRRVAEREPRPAIRGGVARDTRDAHVPLQAGRFSRSRVRVAAMIAMVVLPGLAIAQAVAYIAKHRSAPPQSVATDAQRAPVGDERGSRDLALVEQAIPVVDLPVPTAKTSPLGAILGIKEMSDGRVLVNDAGRRQMRLFSANLATSEIVLDTAAGSAASYGFNSGGQGRGTGPPPSALIPYLGDSSLFRNSALPPVPGVMHVLDGRGRTAREMALFASATPPFPPSAATAGSAQSFNAKRIYADDKGRLLMRAEVQPRAVDLPSTVGGRLLPSAAAGGGRGGAPGGLTAGRVSYLARGDSVPVLRFDYSTRRHDTVGYVRHPVTQRENERGVSPQNAGWRTVVAFDKNGEPTSSKQVIYLLLVYDDWAVLSDGTIAFVRGQDYHVDWIHPDGTRSASPKLPFAWKQLDEAAKQRLRDSVRAAVDTFDMKADTNYKCRRHQMDSMTAVHGEPVAGALYRDLRNRGVLPMPPRFCGDTVVRYMSIPVGGRGSGEVPQIIPGTPPLPPGYREAQSTQRDPEPYEVMPVSEMPDYYPPIGPSAALADRDGNLWILPRSTSLSRQGELVYDVVTPAKGLVKRVRLPLGRSIAGFGKRGVVYLQAGSINTGFILERVSVPGPSSR
jgi:hypothetical protein